MTETKPNQPNETDRLVYKGNRIPIWIVLPWVILAIYCVIYLVRYAYPDLQQWLN